MSAHDGLHLVGCFALMMAFARFRWPRGVVFFTTVFLFITWECLDQLNHVFDWGFSFLDSRGWDSGDIVMDILGIIIALVLLEVTHAKE